MKLMKNSIGAFPNMSMMMTMFNQISDLDVSQQFGFENQENNNQTQILNITVNNFSKYFDVLLMKKVMQNDAHNEADANQMKFDVLMFVDEKEVLLMMDDITDDADLLKTTTEDIEATAKINMNIPLLKTGYMLVLVERHAMTNEDGALSVTIDNNLMMIKKQTLMAILNVVFNNDDSKMMKMIQNTNSNNKKLTNNCKIEINTDNINFSYYCDEIIINVSVFLSLKIDITQIIGSVMMMSGQMYQLQSHLIQSFIVNEDDDKNIDENGDEPTSTTSQSNTNKSEYAFERTLNNFNDDDDDDDDAIVASVKMTKIIRIKLMMMESTTKLFSFMQCWCPSYDEMMKNGFETGMESQQSSEDKHSSGGTGDDDDDDDSGYMMISDETQLKCQKSLLQSLKESDQQSGIVSNNSCKLIISKRNGDHSAMEMMEKDGETVMADMEMMTIEHSKSFGNMQPEEVVGHHPTKNISEIIFSHINDKNETLIVINADNTVNITCDFNYLNYKIKNKINDQIHKDKDSVKDKSCYNNTTTNEEESNTTTNNKNTSSLADKKKTCHHRENVPQTTVAQLEKTTSTLTQIDELIECQRREKQLMRQFEASGRRLRLCGGGEGSLSGASGWGSPPSNTTSNQAAANNPNAGQWGATAQQTPQQNWNQAAQQAGGGSAVPQSQQGQQQIAAAPLGQAQQAGQAQNPNQKPLTPGGPSGGWNQPPQAQIPNPAQQQQQQVVPQQVPGGNGAPGVVGGGTSAVAAKNQLEQLNSMREALFAQDGWGCQNVNQDTNWDVPGSPEPGPRTADQAGATQWKSHTINNGTELWEANLRNGGQPPPQPVQKTPWNHTPTTNIGGTWGEDDDGAQEANVWSGNQNPQTPGWNQGAGANAAAAGGTGMWPATPGKLSFESTNEPNLLENSFSFVGVGGVNANIPKKDNDWGAGQGNASNWGDPRDAMRPNAGAGAGPLDIRNIDPRDPRAPGSLDMRMMDTREPMQGNVRGVTGRLNGSTDMWPHGGMGAGHAGQVPGMNKIVGPGAGAVNNPQWAGSQVGGPKDIDMNKPGWGESSPPATRRPIGADDGTSLWGGSQSRGGPVEPNWKGGQDPRNNFVGRNPIGAGGASGSGPGFPPNRLPGAAMKPDGKT